MSWQSINRFEWKSLPGPEISVKPLQELALKEQHRQAFNISLRSEERVQERSEEPIGPGDCFLGQRKNEQLILVTHVHTDDPDLFYFIPIRESYGLESGDEDATLHVVCPGYGDLLFLCINRAFWGKPSDLWPTHHLKQVGVVPERCDYFPAHARAARKVLSAMVKAPT